MRHITAPITVVAALLLLPACQNEPTAREQAEEGPTAVPQDEALYDPEPGEPATSPATNKVDEVQNEVAEDMMDEDAAGTEGEAPAAAEGAGSAAAPQTGTQAAAPQEKPEAQAPAVEQPAAQPQGETQAQAPAAPAVEQETAEPEAAPAAPAGPSPELIAQGKQLWAKNCKGCHGADGSRTQMGKRTMADMSSDAWQQQATAAGITKTIREGGDGMPGYASRLSDQEIEALVAYTQSL